MKLRLALVKQTSNLQQEIVLDVCWRRRRSHRSFQMVSKWLDQSSEDARVNDDRSGKSNVGSMCNTSQTARTHTSHTGAPLYINGHLLESHSKRRYQLWLTVAT
jgi:hypothetical protein